MSNEANLNKMDFSQSDLFYFWHANVFSIPREEIETYSANKRMIPSNEIIE